MIFDKPIESYKTVKKWNTSLAEQWGGDPLAEDPAKLVSLKSFCDFMDKNPDELYEFCYLRKRDTGERFPSIKRRNEITQKTKKFVIKSELRGTEARRLRSSIFSFFSHNGVLI